MQPRTVINQCYILREPLGEDSFCELWRATSVFNATEFLLRFFKPLPGLAERLPAFRESLMASYSISHPAVADAVDFEDFEGRSFVASAYAGQRSLRALQAEGMSFGLEQLCRYLLELAQGLDAFHNLGLVYGCFNPENALFLISQGRVESVQVQKPGYLGLLELLGDPASEDWRESWAYVAPELKSEGTRPDPRSDVYSLGIHLFRLLTGRLPFAEDGNFLRREPASLSHVAKALLRRGVPESLVRIALRALRPDPARRYADCVRLIAELRDFTDERRALWLRRNGVDPLANIETLNRAGGRIGASQIVRSLDTADYFRLLSETPREHEAPKPQRSFPFSEFSDPQAVRSLEEGEAALRDPGDKEEDSYIGEARKTVQREPWAVAEDLPISAEEGAETSKEEAEIATAPGPEAADSAAAAAAPGPGGRGGADALAAEPDRGPPGTGAEGGMVVEAPRHRRRPPAADVEGIAWKSSRLPKESLIGGLEEALARAKHGRGTFSFVEEPSGPVAAALGRALARFRDEALVVDLRGFPPRADATDFLRMLREPLARLLGAEPPRALRLLGGRLLATKGEGLLAAAPLGSLLYGMDRPEPDPDYLESEEGAELVARSILCLGRRTRPLVLVCRGGEAVGPSAHRLLLELARLSPNSPLCCVVFFSRAAELPRWHVLSKLAGG